MIIDVKKYLILGAQEDLDRFFDRAQEVGVIEFIPPVARKSSEMPLVIRHLLDAMRVLRKLPVKKPYLGGGDLQLAEEIAVKILELKREVERLSEERRLVELEIVRISPFGDFSLSDIDYIEKEGRREVQFFCMKTEKAHQMNIDPDLIYISSDFDLDYFIAINEEPKTYPGMIEMRIDRPLGELQTHLNFVKESLHQIEAELKGYAGHLEFLHEALIERLNDYHLASAKKDVAHPLEDALFAVEAWVPVNKNAELYEVLDGVAVHCEPILVDEHDKIPTYMENKGVNRIGEDLVKIYDIPAHTDKDPSGWVFWAFTLFFAMVVADGGYGLLYLGICLYFTFRYPNLKKSSKRFLKLGIYLSSACVIWGIFTAAFFGIEFSPKSWINKASVLEYLAERKADYHLARKDDVYEAHLKDFPALATAKTGMDFLDSGVIHREKEEVYVVRDAFMDNILLEFSLLAGIIHISLSFLRYLRRNWAGLGWVIFIVGGYLYFPYILKATSLVQFLDIIDKKTSMEVGLQVIYTGIATALFLALVQKRLKGIGEIGVLIQVFADVLSYLRLYALGLAGVIMAETFNGLGRDVGLFLGVLVILAGHSVNIMLGIMAGTIHGLRLNFIEWYHHCFDGDGRLFRPLMRLKFKE